MAANYWLNLESNFQEINARLAEEEKLEADLSWLKRVPVAAGIPPQDTGSLRRGGRGSGVRTLIAEDRREWRHTLDSFRQGYYPTQPTISF